MKRIFVVLMFAIGMMLGSYQAQAQNSAYTNFCTSGSRNATTSGLNSSNLLLSSYTYCTVSVYATGTTTLIPLFSGTGAVLTNPFFASAVTGQYLFYGATGTVVDVTMSAGYPAPGIVTPLTLTGITLGGGGGGGGIGYPPAGIPHSSGASWLASFGIQGTDINVLTSSTITGTGSALCTDANGGATTVGCLSGTLGGSVSPCFTPYSSAPNTLLNSPDFWDCPSLTTHTFVSTTKEVHQTPETDYIGASGVAGSVSFLQGTTPSVIANNVTWAAPASVTGYNFLVPGSQAEGCLFDDGSGNGSWSPCGNSFILPQPVLPSGNYIAIYPTSVTPASGSCTSASGTTGSVSFGSGAFANGTFGGADCPTGGRSASLTYNGFVLPAPYTSANVVSISCGVQSFFTATSFPVINDEITCGPSGSLTTYTMVNTNNPYGFTQNTISTSLTGSQIPTVGVLAAGTGSPCANLSGLGCIFPPIPSSATTLASVFLIVQLNVAPPAAPATIPLVAPIININGGIGIDESFPFPGKDLTPWTYQNAYADASGAVNPGVYYVNDNTNALSTNPTNCGPGGGTFGYLCVWNAGSGQLVPLTTTSGTAYTNVTVNGGSNLATANFNGSTPAAGTNGFNVTFQNSGANISAEVVGDGNAAHCLIGTGTFATCPGSGGGSPAGPVGSIQIDAAGSFGASDKTTILNTQPVPDYLDAARFPLAKWLQSMHNASDAVAHLAVIGDSYAICDNGLCSAGPTVPTNRWVEQLRINLQNAYGYGGTGMMPLSFSATGININTENYPSTTGTLDNSTSSLGPSGAAGNALIHLPTGATVTFSPGSNLTPHLSYDTLIIYCMTNSGSGSLAVSIDSGAHTGTACGTTSGSPTAHAVSISAGSLTTHTAVVTSTGDSYIYAMEGTAGTTGIRVSNLGYGGATSGYFGSSATAQLAFSDLEPAGTQGAIVMLQTNDITQSTAVSTFSTNMGAIISHELALSTAPSLMLAIPPVSGTSGSFPASSYTAAQQALYVADAVDEDNIQWQWGTTFNSGSGLWSSDNVHPNDKGALSEFSQIYSKFVDNVPVPSPSSGGGTTTNALTMNNSGSGAASGTTFNGSAAEVISYNTIGAPGISGTPTTGHCVDWASASTLGDSGSTCGGGGGGISNISITVSSATQGANSCSSPATATMTGVATSGAGSHVTAAYLSDPTSLTGWGSSGGMVFQVWPSAANTVSWIVCNQTPASITFSTNVFSIGAQ